jgi:serine protease Do
MQIGSLAKNKEGLVIGPAKAAGLREDDIITAVNGTPISSTEQFRALVASTSPGTTLKFSVTRPEGDGAARQFDTDVTLGDRNALLGGAATPKPVAAIQKAIVGFGIEVANADKISTSDKAKFGLSGKEKGAVITRVAPGSPADEADLTRGLRVVRARIEGVWQSVPDAASWQNIEKAAVAQARILLQLRDQNEVSIYKVLIAPEKVAATTVTG